MSSDDPAPSDAPEVVRVSDPAIEARRHAEDLRALARLVVEATQGVTGIVEAMHRTIAQGPNVLGRPLERPARAITGLVYGRVRGVTQLVGASLDLALERLNPLLGESAPGPAREAVLAAINGVLGDALVARDSPLAIPMRLRLQGRALTLDPEALRAVYPQPSDKLLVLVHGSCMNDLQWRAQGHDHGEALSAALGYSPVYVHYNSGLHISTNGRALSEQLSALVAAWPGPLTQLVLLGHSMGGLVARSACDHGERDAAPWRGLLRALITLGTPHLGAPLERGGNLIDQALGVSRYSAPLSQLGKIRSSGVTDLRYGSVRDEDWQGHDRFARADAPRPLSLPADVRCYAIAASGSMAGDEALSGDGLVPVDSALGRSPDPARALAIPAAHQWIARGCDHLGLLRGDGEVFTTLHRWLSAP